jgi:hypothetical protein
MLGKWLRRRDGRPTDEKEIFQHHLLVILSALAQTKAEQLAYAGIGCVTCDLVEDFDMYGVRLYRKEHHTPAQNEVIRELHEMIEVFCKTDQECFDPSVLDRADWAAIRTQAEKALNSFGFRLTALPKPLETQPGVWSTDILAHKLNRL